MANTKLSAFSAVSSALGTHEIGVNEAGTTKKATLQQVRTYLGTGLNNASLAGVASAYAVDTYLAGSAITIPTAGGWVAGSIYCCTFDMTKTAAGTATFTIQVRMGTLGTIADASILTLGFGVGSAVADVGRFDVICVFRSVGAGTAAVLSGIASIVHTQTLAGLASNFGTPGFSAGFDSTTQTVIGLSVNGGAAFSGTNFLVAATLDKYQ